jgi:carbonic anhydrase
MHSHILEEILAANATYARDFGDKRQLTGPPTRQFAILTCMDARMDIAKITGLREGDAHVVRNAGGRATEDAIRSLIVSYKMAGTRLWLVIHHTDCAMETFTDEQINSLLAQSLGPAKRAPDGSYYDDNDGPAGSNQGQFIHWHTIQDRYQSVIDDVHRLRSHPLVPRDLPIYGLLYDVHTGMLHRVHECEAVSDK